MRLTVLRNIKFATFAALASLTGCASEPVGVDWVHPDTRTGKLEYENDQVPALMRVAKGSMEAGDFGTAIGLYRKAHSIDRGNPKVLVALGKALSAAGAHNEALETYAAAVNLDPGMREAIHGKGNALIALDQPRAAMSQFEAALSLNEDARSFSGMGVAFDMLGQHRAAQACYRVGLDYAHDDLSLLNNLGLSLAFDGQYAESIRVLRKVAAHPQATSRHRLNLALAYGLAGDSDAAAAIARKELDEASVQSNLAYYRSLRALAGSRTRMDAVGAFLGVEGPADKTLRATQ